jgi:hypothetical protein
MYAPNIIRPRTASAHAYRKNFGKDFSEFKVFKWQANKINMAPYLVKWMVHVVHVTKYDSN